MEIQRDEENLREIRGERGFNTYALTSVIVGDAKSVPAMIVVLEMMDSRRRSGVEGEVGTIELFSMIFRELLEWKKYICLRNMGGVTERLRGMN